MANHSLQNAIRLLKAGDVNAAMAAAQKAISREDNNAERLAILAMVFLRCNNLSKAEDTIRKAISLEPNNANLQCNLALVQSANNLDLEAIDTYQQALNINPNLAEAHLNLSILQRKLNRIDEAVTSCKRAILLNPELIQAHNTLGNLYRDRGNPKSAIKEYRYVVNATPDNYLAYNNLGGALFDLGKYRQAITEYQKAIKIDPRRVEAYRGLTQTFSSLGQKEEAIIYARQAAIRSDNSNHMDWQAFASSLRGADINSFDNSLLDDIEQCLSIDDIEHQGLAITTIKLLKKTHEFTVLTEIHQKDLLKRFEEEIKEQGQPVIFSRQAFPMLLTRTIVADEWLESILTILRHAYLNVVQSTAHIDDNRLLNSAITLANQCFLNEYIYDESDEEKRIIKDLCDAINTKKVIPNGLDYRLAILAMYRPLFKALPNDFLSTNTKILLTGFLSGLVKTQILEPMEELLIKKNITTLTPITDMTSSMVKAQYEDNPYPRWSSTILRKPISVMTFINSISRNPETACTVFPSNPKILIAGCGSGRHAIGAARRFANSEILAIDLSRTSLAYAIRKAKELDIRNITFAQADILELSCLNRKFDVIECSGVLHHMKDPLAGWKVLIDILEDHGYLQIGLYSEIARRCIVAAREIVSANKYPPTPQGIRQLRRYIFNQKNNALLRQILNFRDFFSMSGCRDLIFNVQEHRFQLPQIQLILDQFDLELVGIQHNKPSIFEYFKAMFPENPDIKSLELWNQFEQVNPLAFMAMYLIWMRKRRGHTDA
jgi:tetratricopeptide (TPR) repeat protein